MNTPTKNKMKVGISACVMGQNVRFDGGHKRSTFCTQQLSEFVQFKPICPEVAVGLPTPRKSIRQIDKDGLITLSRPDGSQDVTQAVTQYGKDIANTATDIAGFIFCAKSPTCGMERVKVYHHNGQGSSATGVGLFAEQIMQANPALPVEESGRLNDPILRENFITRIFTYQKWLTLTASGLSKHKLIAFHSQLKYLVLSHHLESYQQLGQLLGMQSHLPIDVLAKQYIHQLMEGLRHIATKKSHTNTLQHLQGYFKQYLTPSRRAELSDAIMSYRKGIAPLLVPLTLIKHYLLEFPNDYLSQQAYLNPHPETLKLRYGY
ncbi:DUF523 and DUF1722 domain-containing protein [uncultured Shewanella sp.]|uniref:YbgA family protein n=1 Tax=uncultured Shewanella sp. TaxID=173975 RepID=UPI0026385332|nr:DUF523 and DUF1722 domain-containing protein [uncultured Shewanella sp.]